MPQIHVITCQSQTEMFSRLLKVLGDMGKKSAPRQRKLGKSWLRMWPAQYSWVVSHGEMTVKQNAKVIHQV